MRTTRTYLKEKVRVLFAKFLFRLYGPESKLVKIGALLVTTVRFVRESLIYSCFALVLPEAPGRANGNGEIFRYGAAKVFIK